MNNWIRADLLPDPYIVVLVWRTKHDGFECYRLAAHNGNAWHGAFAHEDLSFDLGRISHWMHLPSPPTDLHPASPSNVVGVTHE